MKIVAGEEKKQREILGSQPFGAPPFGAPLFLGLGLHPSSLHSSGPNSPEQHASGRSLRGPTLRPFVGNGQKSGLGQKWSGPKEVSAGGHPLRCPPFGPHSSGPLRGTLPPPDRPKFLPYFPLQHPFSLFFFPLWGSSRGILVVFEAPGPSNVHVWAFAKCQEQFYNFSFPKKSMTIYYKFCLYPEKSLEHTEIPREDTPPPSGPTPLGPHFFWVVVCAVCIAPDSAACCCSSCCRCFCCYFCLLLLFGRRPSNPLLHLCSV